MIPQKLLMYRRKRSAAFHQDETETRRRKKSCGDLFQNGYRVRQSQRGREEEEPGSNSSVWSWLMGLFSWGKMEQNLLSDWPIGCSVCQTSVVHTVERGPVTVTERHGVLKGRPHFYHHLFRFLKTSFRLHQREPKYHCWYMYHSLRTIVYGVVYRCPFSVSSRFKILESSQIDTVLWNLTVSEYPKNKVRKKHFTFI